MRTTTFPLLFSYCIRIKKEAAVCNGQQLKSSNEIIEQIIKMFAENVISISDANYILDEVSKRLCEQPVVVISEDIKKIYKMRNRGIIKF